MAELTVNCLPQNNQHFIHVEWTEQVSEQISWSGLFGLRHFYWVAESKMIEIGIAFGFQWLHLLNVNLKKCSFLYWCNSCFSIFSSILAEVRAVEIRSKFLSKRAFALQLNATMRINSAIDRCVTIEFNFELFRRQWLDKNANLNFKFLHKMNASADSVEK